MRRFTVCGVFLLLLVLSQIPRSSAGELVGMTVTPHRIEPALRYRRPRDTSLGARVQLFVRGPVAGPRFAGKSPAELLADDAWTWHDLDAQPALPADALGVWNFNGRDANWGVDREFSLEADGLPQQSVAVAAPKRWISAATFLALQGPQPESIVLHVSNDSPRELQTTSLRLWLPKTGESWHTLWPQTPLAAIGRIPSGGKGVVKIMTAPLPLTYAVLELATDSGPLWAQVRIKPEAFDISGGWIFDSKVPWKGDKPGVSPFLDLLCHMHVNTAHFETASGYSDDPAMAERYPLKRFHRLQPLEQWDVDAWLPKIHAVEFLGEPQYGGGRPVPPQEVFDKLLPYRTSRLATSVTHSEERTWRYYAGLSDYPHYDAYRVVAPAADAWREYDRWGGRRIGWGAPLETIGDLSRSLRELNRPAPCAVWSQGPHHDWGGGLFRGGRARRSPTPDELRAQAMHALSTRITSLYWFNLSVKSVVKFPDTWDAMTRIGREIQMLAPLYLEGDAFGFERRTASDGAPDWDLATIAAPDGAVLFALDTAYVADPTENVFRFGEPRPATFEFALPVWLQKPADLFHVDADGIHPVTWRCSEQGVVIDDVCSRDRIYVAARTDEIRLQIEQRRKGALDHEMRYTVDREAIERLLK